jgi:antitoxin (DNA-binding transcriptional repressor) of toxin-antitoxin stability system
MKFVSTRELRNRPGAVREMAQKEDLVLTADGKPIAILLGVENEDLEESLVVLRQARAQRALSRMRSSASRLGLAPLSAGDVEREIRAVRRQRKRR